MLRNLATSLINSDNEYIITTLPKAKELRSFVEKAITLSRRAQHLNGETAQADAVHLRRQAAAYFHAGNRAYKQEMSRFRGKKGEPKERPERTAGVKAVQRLFNELGARYKDRNGGYTRITKMPARRGDAAPLAILTFVE